MSQYRKIFLIADAVMQRTPAFDEAIGLAKATGASLHVCMFLYSSSIAAASAFDKKGGQMAIDNYVERHEAWLAAESGVLREEGLHVTTDAVWAHPLLEEMLAQITELSPDLVVKDVHHEPLLKRLLFTSLDWQLLRLCPAPLLLASGLVPRTPRKIIVAVDPARLDGEEHHDDFNESIVSAALGMAIQCQAELHLAYAMFPAVIDYSVPGAAVPLSGDIYREIAMAQQRLFDEFADAHGVPKGRRHFLIGTAGREIPQLAAEIGADTIVLGSVHRTGIDRLLMGSTAERILEHVPCNVLAIKPSAFAEEYHRWLAGQQARQLRS